MKKTKIRHLNSSDFEEFDILIKQFYSYAGNKVPENEEIQRLFEKAMLPECNFFFLVATSNDKLIGIISYAFVESSYKVAPFVWCDDLFIDENYRNLSIGTQLIQKLADIAKGSGCSCILGGVGENEIDTQRFYKKNQFVDLKNKIFSRPID